jgi:hypothetical protein
MKRKSISGRQQLTQREKSFVEMSPRDPFHIIEPILNWLLVIKAMKFILLLLLLLTFWLPSAAQKPDSNSNTARQTGTSVEPVITYEYSGGPSYNIYVTNDRTLVYEGHEYVKTKGKVTAKITDIQFQELMSSFKNAGFFSLRDSYNSKGGCASMGSEGPWVKLVLRTGKRVKSIDHDLSCDWGSKKFTRGVKTLVRLENRIHDILDIDQWIGTEEERSKLPDPLLLPKKVSWEHKRANAGFSMSGHLLSQSHPHKSLFE